jgi:hypothetical protein
MFKKLKIIVSVILLVIALSGFSQITKEFPQENFNTLQTEGVSSFLLIQSDENKVEVIVENKEIIDYIDIKVTDGILAINTTSKNKNISKMFSKLTFKVYFRNLEYIVFSGAGSIKSENPIKSKKLEAELEGTGNIDLIANTQKFTGKMKGTGSFSIEGNSQSTELFVAGVGSLNATNLISKNTSIVLNGVGHAQVYASENLEATLNGLGSIKYTGNPQNKDFEVNGLGSIKELE